MTLVYERLSLCSETPTFFTSSSPAGLHPMPSRPPTSSRFTRNSVKSPTHDCEADLEFVVRSSAIRKINFLLIKLSTMITITFYSKAKLLHARFITKNSLSSAVVDNIESLFNRIFHTVSLFPSKQGTVKAAQNTCSCHRTERIGAYWLLEQHLPLFTSNSHIHPDLF